MCLVLFSYDPDGRRPLVVAANRDEFYARPARSAHYWDEAPTVFAGRDLSAGGSWLGVTASGRFATVTNFAEEAADEVAPQSRGALVGDFLTGTATAHDLAHHVQGAQYKGFNLLLYDGERLVYTSNRGITEDLDAGVYGLANAELGATWPKVESGRGALTAARERADPRALIDLLHDETQPPDDLLPRRGRPIELERRVAPCFIRGEEYGTRASTAVIFENGEIRFAEQNYGPGGAELDALETVIEIFGG